MPIQHGQNNSLVVRPAGSLGLKLDETLNANIQQHQCHPCKLRFAMTWIDEKSGRGQLRSDRKGLRQRGQRGGHTQTRLMGLPYMPPHI